MKTLVVLVLAAALLLVFAVPALAFPEAELPPALEKLLNRPAPSPDGRLATWTSFGQGVSINAVQLNPQPEVPSSALFDFPPSPITPPSPNFN